MKTFENGLTYATKRINADFRIKVYGNNNGERLHKLVGVKGYIEIVGDCELASKMLKRAYDAGVNKVVCKLRRGVKITFYVK